MAKEKDDDYDSVEINEAQWQQDAEKTQRPRPAPPPAKQKQEVKPAAPAAPKLASAPPAPAPVLGLEQPAADVCTRFALGHAARPLLQDGQKTRAYLQALVDAKQFIDAVKVLAHAVPKREGVWWACQCCRQDPGVEKAPKVLAALEAGERWVADPSEDNRRAAYPAAEAAGFDTPAGCAAVAAFWSGGSLGPPNVPVIPPGEGLTAHGVAGAILLAAATAPPAEVANTYRKFLARGVAVADGKNRWKDAAAPAAGNAKPPPAAGPAASAPAKSFAGK
jgi:hypothetical protein